MKKTLAGLGLAATALTGVGTAAVSSAPVASASSNHVYGHMAAEYKSLGECYNTRRGVERSIAAHGGRVIGESGRGRCFIASYPGKKQYYGYGEIVYSAPRKVWNNDRQYASYADFIHVATTSI